jgi:hypothetical protein
MLNNIMETIKKIYLDDIRTPLDSSWIVVRNYNEFIDKVKEIGLNNIDIISFDHDLGDSAIEEYMRNVIKNYKIDYSNITEKTGYDAIKWLVDYFYELNPERFELSNEDKKKNKINFPKIYVHSANPVGAHNICGLVNNFLKNERQSQDCVRVQIEHN